MTYCIVTSWLYPTESGRDIDDRDFADAASAWAAAERLADEERANFMDATGCEPKQAFFYDGDDGELPVVLVECANGIDEWEFKAEVVALEGCPIRSGMTSKEFENSKEEGWLHDNGRRRSHEVQDH